MFDWVKKLFGEGHIYADIVCDDGTVGRTRAAFIGDPATFDRGEYIRHLKQEIWFKHGKRVTDVTNLQII